MPLSEADARGLAAAAFQRAGVPGEAARDAAEILTLAEMMGIPTHGLGRVAVYTSRIAAGGIAPAAEVIVRAPAPAIRHVDGQNGLGPATTRRALAEAMQAARAVGVGAVFCRGMNHLGALAPYLWLAAEAGFASIMTTTTAPMIAPAGGRQALVGNNPVGIGIPDPGGTHVLLDIALSVAARSKVRAAAAANEAIPASWATGADGRPTTDAAEAMRGLMQAIGGGKGASLALSLDLLVGGLSGAAMLADIPNTVTSPESVQNLGQLIMLIDTTVLLPDAALSDRLHAARHSVEHSAPVDPEHPVRMPGTRAIRALHDARRDGLALPPATLAALRALAQG